MVEKGFTRQPIPGLCWLLGHPFRKIGGSVPKTSRMSNLPCCLHEVSPAKRRGSDLFRNLLLSFFFGEKSQAMKRPSLRSVKCLPRRDRDALLVVVLCETREKGTEVYWLHKTSVQQEPICQQR
jgi:hypothetical protein